MRVPFNSVKIFFKKESDLKLIELIIKYLFVLNKFIFYKIFIFLWSQQKSYTEIYPINLTVPKTHYWYAKKIRMNSR